MIPCGSRPSDDRGVLGKIVVRDALLVQLSWEHSAKGPGLEGVRGGREKERVRDYLNTLLSFRDRSGF